MLAGCVQLVRNLPFMKNIPEDLFLTILRAGELVLYGAGDVIWDPPPHDAAGDVAGQGIFVVLHGIVRSSYIGPDSVRQVRKPQP